jgi:hypothetical protein
MSVKHDKVAARNGNNRKFSFLVEVCRISRTKTLRAQAPFPDIRRTSGTPLFRTHHNAAEITSQVRSMQAGKVDTTSEL